MEDDQLMSLLHPGVRVRYHGRAGKVVANASAGEFSDSAPADEWRCLGQGVLLEVDGYGLLHLDEPDEDLEIVE
jgi:hypothetical protein